MASPNLSPDPEFVSIYVIGAEDGPMKVGLSRKPLTRLAQLRVHCPDELLLHYDLKVPALDASTVEKYAHALLWQKRVRGEWFDVPTSAAIKAVDLGAVGVAAGRLPPSGRLRKPGRTGLSTKGGQEHLSPERAAMRDWYRERFVRVAAHNPFKRTDPDRHEDRATIRAAHDLIRAAAGETGVTIMRLVAGQGYRLCDLSGSDRQRKLFRNTYDRALDALTPEYFECR